MKLLVFLRFGAVLGEKVYGLPSSSVICPWPVHAPASRLNDSLAAWHLLVSINIT